MKILGIDPGLATTGWSLIIKGEKQKLIKYGCVLTNKNKQSSQRLAEIYQYLTNLIREHKPNVVCIEKLFFNTNAKTALAIGEARGVIKVCAFLNKIPITEFTPLQIKNSIVGYGRADKKQVQNMVKALLKLDSIPKPDDAADATAVALTYCFYNPMLKSLII